MNLKLRSGKSGKVPLGGKPLLIILLFLFFIGCKSKQLEGRLPDEYFSIKTEIKDYNSGSYGPLYYELDAGVEYMHYYFALTWDRNRVCWNVQFYRVHNESNYLVKVRRFNDGGFRAFYFRWKNIPYEYKTFDKLPYIYSNLDEEKVRILYPDYHGKIIKENVKSFEINEHFYWSTRDFVRHFKGVTVNDTVKQAEEDSVAAIYFK